MKRLFIILFFSIFSVVAAANPLLDFLSLFSKTEPPSENVLNLAKTAYQCAVASGIPRPKTLTIIDYSLASNQKRMWVYDMQQNRIIYNSLVSHGVGSGVSAPTRFSNQPNSRASSLGLYLTANPYIGHYGYSLRLIGLDEGYNDLARMRALVIHGINAKHGNIATTWGCPAVPKRMAKPIINTIKEGNLVFAYYPDQQWLKDSKFLHCAV